MLRFSWSKKIKVSNLNGLFEVIGWKKRPKNRWKSVLKNSRFVLSVWNGRELIGLGRLVDDGVMCMFYDIGVHPNFQSKGVGTRIMQRLISKIKNKKRASIGLFAWDKNPQNIAFYKSIGFEHSSGMELKKFMSPE